MKKLHVLGTVAAIAAISVSGVGPARAECVTGTASDTATQKFNFCTGAFNTAPFNATWVIVDTGTPTIDYTMFVNTLTEWIIPDRSNPGAALLRYGKSGTTGFEFPGFNGGRGGDAPSNTFLSTEILLDFNTPDQKIATIGPTTGSALNQMGHGLVAISRGGNGGRGGDSLDILFGVGGDGGHAAPGETARITAFGDISTAGVSAHGILAQSLGGNGGRGGHGSSIAEGEGGQGGNAAGGGTASVTSWSNIFTNGETSHGIMAQSAGGRAGAGGDGAGIVGEGGLGGTAAPGGTATVTTNTGDITTLNNGSYGIFAQSIGGFGGAGGDGGGILGWGARGESAGAGGTATVISRSKISTTGNDAHGIFAQSVGGGGGIGGDGVGIDGLGASGGIGGAGGRVDVRTLFGVLSPIQTSGDRSIGLFAESIGGGGGDGGSAAGLLSLGGRGSATSPGGFVSVRNSSPISTLGAQSHGLLAQSIGGGGGNGGASLGLFTIGGDGGGGGDGGQVQVRNLIGFDSSVGKIRTEGDQAVGVFAQSVGGGGGNGGAALAGGVGFAMSIGGQGGSGGDGGNVGVNPFITLSELRLIQTGSISTGGFLDGGYKSHGIQAQSIGGGGGNGGFAFSAAAGSGGSASVALGGNGGAGGDAGTVLVNQHGSIATSRGSANGIFAQSVGGGGGDGGGTIAAAFSGGKSLSFALGGAGGTGGKANTVEVNYGGLIQTGGTRSNGIFAQSVGGGGGNGGFSAALALGQVAASFALGGDGGAGSEGSDVTVRVIKTGAFPEQTDIIATAGDLANGIFAQSVGGGGGNGGFAGAGSLAASSSGSAIGLSMGGSGGEGGFAGNVNVSNVNQIWTFGTKSVGILAQSVGGGGGNGGFSLTAGGGGGKGLSAAIGGDGGGGNAGGIVNVTNSGLITTVKDQSYGILAQSVGGGGGNGGFAFSGSAGMQLADSKGLSVSAAIGGGGGLGSDGGAVTVNNTGSVVTSGQTTHAIVAQSVGGGGGNGGWAGSVAINAGNGAAIGMAIGGTGGSGGDGGAVALNSGIGVSGDTIDTNGAGASGLFAQSVGGGGGNGGHGFAGAFGYGAGEKTINASVAIGGGGGDGGLGSSVDVDNQSGIITRGENANGIFAQSIGGGGGNGGFAVTGTLSLPSPMPGAKTLPVGVSIGGGGGSGGVAGNVSVTNTDTITTLNIESRGIMAQSIGGGGGNGGLAVTAQLTGAATRTAVVGASVGGAGGTGNMAGTVTVTNDLGGAINTAGFGSHGIEAQSIGGGGGNGGMSVVTQLGKAGGTPDDASKTLNVGIGVGGGSGDGGFGNTVNVTNHDAIDVQGNTAMGIYAQSIGGGGGDGGGAVTAFGLQSGTADSSSKELNINATVGGGGGNGNHGGAVSVANTGSITTRSGTGHGIKAQSIGGGGGTGGRANTFDFVKGKNNATSYTLGATVGGSGGGASNGNTVTVQNDGAIETFGNVADGIHAQSIGGGGGDGGNGVNGFEELVPTPGAFSLLTEFERAEFDQVIVSVGGDQGSSGNGGLVTVVNNDDITTRGWHSVGIFAQSIGGGGGVGGNGVSGLTGALGLGGKGGAAGNGGAVGVAQTGATIETFGRGASGIMAHSVGGGGGVAGNVGRMFSDGIPGLGFGNIGIGAAVGQGGGAGGSGNIVQVVFDGAIVTRGNSAAGIFAQSVGGGGGALGDLGAGRLGSWALGSNGDAGNGGPVFIDVTGSVTTAGDYANGIFAQSAGGLGTGNVVNVTVGNAAIETGAVLDATLGGADLDIAGNQIRGQGAVGIMAQSVGNAANGSITINIQGAGSIVRGGRRGSGAAGVGIAIIDGNQNNIINRGLVTTLDGVDDGFAILATGSNQADDPNFNATFAAQEGGNEAVSNFGTVTGSVDLGAGQNSFVNEVGGTLNAGEVIKVGDLNLLTNSGTLLPGGIDNILTTTITGDFLQTAAGSINLDVMLGPVGIEVDQLFVTGDIDLGGGLAAPAGGQGLAGAAAGTGLGGTVVFNLADALTLAQFSQSYTIFDFIFGGSEQAPIVLTDSALFADVAFMGLTSAGAVELLLATDGSLAAIPLPAALPLFGAGLALLGFVARRRSKV